MKAKPTAQFFIWCLKFQVLESVVSKFIFSLLASKFLHLFSPHPILTILVYTIPQFFSLMHQSAKMSTSTQDPDSTCYQRLLQTVTEAFMRSMKSDEHRIQRYKTYVKDLKLILDDHVADLMSCGASNIAKQVLRMVINP